MILTYPVKPRYPGGNGVPEISQKFGEKLLDYSQVGLPYHNGVDFPHFKGSPIYAVHDGWIIEQVAKDTGYGLRISQLIEDDGIYVGVYGHMERLENPVTFGWNFHDRSHPVKRGDIIGYVNSTGFSTGNHLHFGLYEFDGAGNKLYPNNGVGGAIDPLPFFRTNPMNSNVKIINHNGTIFYAIGVATPQELAIFNRIFNTNVTPNPDGSIPADITL